MRSAPPGSHKALMNRAIGGIDKRSDWPYTVVMNMNEFTLWMNESVTRRYHLLFLASSVKDGADYVRIYICNNFATGLTPQEIVRIDWEAVRKYIRGSK